jgi:hypothetical protein
MVHGQRGTWLFECNGMDTDADKENVPLNRILMPKGFLVLLHVENHSAIINYGSCCTS